HVAIIVGTGFMEKFNVTKYAIEIIGRLGLGFHSAVMVGDKVEIDTLSYQEGAEPAHWVCNGSTSYEISKGSRTSRGTDVILHINEESEEFLDKFRLQEIL